MLLDGRIEMRLTDAGVPFDPRTDLSTSTREDAIRSETEGGVGWLMVLHWCESIAYERIHDRNELTLSLPFANR